MKQIIFVIIYFVITVSTAIAQDKFLERGNYYLDIGKFDKAEQTFKDAIKSDSNNLIYQSQLGFTLIQKRKFTDAEEILVKVLKVDSNNIGAIWYGGICSFSDFKFRKAISRFEKSLSLLDENTGQYYSALWFIGKCYSELLKSEGLTYEETDRMFECFEEYLKLQPNAEDAKDLRNYIDRKKKRRPPSNVKIWIDL